MKLLKFITVLLFLMLYVFQDANAQTYTMSNNTVTTDTGYFYDSGGSGGNYGYTDLYTMVFYPATDGNMLQFIFEEFRTCYYSNYLKIYDGASTNAKLIGTFFGDEYYDEYFANNMPDTIIATNIDGALTFKFHSFMNCTSLGWKANISSISPDFINESPIAFFDFDTIVGEPLSIQFSSYATNKPDSWNWDFGDGNFSTERNPIHQYDQEGVYDIKLIVSNDFGKDALTKKIKNKSIQQYNMSNDTVQIDWGYFYDSAGKDGKPENNEDYTMTFYPKSENVQLHCVFTDFNLYKFNASMDYLEVYDGNSVDALMIGRYTMNNKPDHIIATNADGALTFKFHSIQDNVSGTRNTTGWEAIIYEEPASNFDIRPNSYFDYKETSVSTPLAVQFWDYSQNKPNSWNWDFGDGNSSNERNPVYTFPRTGIYDVKLIATNEIGSDTIVKTVHTSDVDVTLMSNDSVYTDTTIFYDSGGATENYSKQEDYKLTFFPETSSKMIQASFDKFIINDSYPKLKIYNGSSTSAPLINSFRGIDSIGTITANNVEGALTFHFYSDGRNTYEGWKAIIKSVDPVKYSITYHNVGNVRNNNPKEYTILDEIRFIEPNSYDTLNYVFEGWYTRQYWGSSYYIESPIDSVLYGSTGDKDIYAKWLPDGDEAFKTGNFLITSKSPTCRSFSDGSITVKTEIFDMELSVKETGKNYTISKGDSIVIENLESGTYNINTLIVKGVERNFTVEIQSPEEIKSSALVQGHTVSFNIEGGVAPYSVQLGNDTYYTETGRLTVNHLKAGNYSAIIQDENPCTEDLTISFNVEILNVYPNPVSENVLFVELPTSIVGKQCKILILTPDGSTKIVKNNIIEKIISVDVSSLKPNIYLLQVISDEYNATQRFIVNE